MDIIHHLCEQTCRHHIASGDMFPKNGDDTTKWTSRFAKTNHLNQLLTEAQANAQFVGDGMPEEISDSLRSLWQTAALTLDIINWAPKGVEIVSSQAARLYYLIIGVIWQALGPYRSMSLHEVDVPGTLEPFEGILDVSGYAYLWTTGDIKASVLNIESAAKAIRNKIPDGPSILASGKRR